MTRHLVLGLLALLVATRPAVAQPALAEPAPPPPIAPARPFAPTATDAPPRDPAARHATAVPHTPEPAPPDPAAEAALRARAKAKSELGRRHYELGEYRTAIAAYREAYLTLPSDGVLFNLGQAYRLAGDCVAAASAYRGFLRSERGGPARQLATQQLATVETCARDELARDASHDRRERTLRRTGLAIGAVGVVGLALATYFAVDAADAEAAVEAHVGGGGRWSEIADTDARGHRSSGLALGFGLGGGIAVATGALVYLVHRDDGAREHDPRLWVSPGATTTTAGVSWGF